MIKTFETPIGDALKTERHIRTNSGLYLDVFNPDPNSILIEDIAHALSMLCRFSGHINQFYSVAEHSLYVSYLLPEELRLEGLLHDATEAYLVDLPTPIKRNMEVYRSVEDNLMSVIAAKFKINFPFHPLIKQADVMALEYEWKNLMINNNLIKTLAPLEAKPIFIEHFKHLTK
jgi:5'-deoxynucleotidase YfbR-like HD superfamily hydrolase